VAGSFLWQSGAGVALGSGWVPALTALIGALQLLCVLNRREFDGPISPFKKIQDTLIKSPLTWGTVPASYKT
jgi:hypothetical protein